MTREEHFVRKTNLIAQIDSAEKLGCKNVLKCAKLELAKLESKYKKEHLSNPLFSYMVTRKEMDKLIEDEVNPTFQIHVTFKGGEVYDLMYYHEIAPGVKHSTIEKWAKDELAKTIHHPEDIVNTHFIMG
jgi:hypothetical protein|nr:MAG TPA: hypothetical protein [Caudoviricetes sp.]